jgi:rod shape-determining protein MreC
MLITWFMLGGFIFLLAPQSWTNKFQFAFARIFSWPLNISRGLSLSARAKQLPMDVVSRVEYDRLQNHLDNVMAELNQAHQELKALAGLRERFPALEGAKFVVADVITDTVSGLRSELIVNRGSDDGLAKGQFVLGDNSVVGTVSSVSTRTAQVKLITDPTSSMAVNVPGLDISRVMKGGGEIAKIQMLSIQHKVKTGENVYACKKPGFLDTPIVVGKIEKCTRDDENPSLWNVTVRPACDISKLDNVVVLIMNPQQ